MSNVRNLLSSFAFHRVYHYFFAPESLGLFFGLMKSSNFFLSRMHAYPIFIGLFTFECEIFWMIVDFFSFWKGPRKKCWYFQFRVKLNTFWRSNEKLELSICADKKNYLFLYIHNKRSVTTAAVTHIFIALAAIPLHEFFKFIYLFAFSFILGTLNNLNHSFNLHNSAKL